MQGRADKSCNYCCLEEEPGSGEEHILWRAEILEQSSSSGGSSEGCDRSSASELPCLLFNVSTSIHGKTRGERVIRSSSSPDSNLARSGSGSFVGFGIFGRFFRAWKSLCLRHIRICIIDVAFLSWRLPFEEQVHAASLPRYH